MSKTKKISIIIACIMIGIGLIISICTYAAVRFDFSKLSTVQMVRNTYTIDESFSSINIDCAEGSVRFVPSDSGICEVICAEEERITHSVEVIDDTLTVIRTDNREWHELIGIYWYEEGVELTVSLPQSSYEKLYVKSLSGNISVPNGFNFSDIQLYSTSGNISSMAETAGNIRAESVSGDVMLVNADSANLYAKTSSGDVMIASSVTEGEITATTVSGDIAVAESTAEKISASCTSGDVDLMNAVTSGEFNVKTVSGDIELNRCDGGSLDMKTTSGDVEGTLRTGKLFLVHSTSGDVRVPDDMGTEKCEITTTSGDVKIKIKE